MRKNKYSKLEMYPLPDVKPCKLLIIGESVNIDELVKGEYFLSKGADVINKTLETCNVDLEQCSYSVAIPFLLNKIKTIPPDSFKENHDRLWNEIKYSGANIVMPLGTIATQILLNDKQSSITKTLGNVIDKNGVTIVPNYHPAMLYHQPGNYKTFQLVIENVSKLLFKLDHNPGITQYEILDSKDKILEFTKKLEHIPYVAADIETSGLQTWSVNIWVMGICYAKNKAVVIPREMFVAYPGLIMELFELSKWIWHNGKYDKSVLYWNNFNNVRVDHDTILLHYCLNETSGTHNLGICATLYLGADEYKSKMNSEFSKILTEDAYYLYKSNLIERVAIDVDYTFQLFEVLHPIVSCNRDWDSLYNNILLPASDMLTKVQIRGAKMDIDYLKSRIPYYERSIEQITEDIQIAASPFYDRDDYMVEKGAKSAPIVYNPSSTKQTSWLVWDRLKLRPNIKCKVRETGEKVLQSIKNPPEFIALVLQLRKVKKEYSTYVKNYIKNVDSNNILHCNFNLHSTATGRLSCTDENIQNVPSKGESGKAIRRAFIPRSPGRVLLEIDYSGAELRVLGFVSQDAALIKAVTEGDLHSEVAEKIFGPDFTKDQRGMAKTINFGIAYGRSGGAIDDAFGLTKGEGDQMIKMWSELYPQAWEYLEGCTKSVRLGEPLTTVFGRWRRMGLISSNAFKNLSNEAKNFRIQSISSDNTLIAALEVDETLESKYDALIINLIHDSILIDCPGDLKTVTEVSKYVVQAMKSVPFRHYACNVKFACDVDLGVDWGHVYPFNYKDGTIKTKEGTFNYEIWKQNYN